MLREDNKPVEGLSESPEPSDIELCDLFSDLPELEEVVEQEGVWNNE